MITCQLYGRLGNQLFQLATTLAYAKRYGIPWGIPQKITCPPGLVTDPVYFTHFPQPDYFPAPVYIHENPDQSYNELPKSENGWSNNIILSGYFQSEKYFYDQRSAIIQALNFPRPGRMHPPSISIHVRRGDYLEKPDCHPLLGMDYYAQAINYFRDWESIGNRFLVFSDDMPWCLKYLNSVMFPLDTFEYFHTENPIFDMAAMASCSHHIIANSSFSWWGAWLNENPDKCVIAPRKWYGSALSHIRTKDLLPGDWVKI